MKQNKYSMFAFALLFAVAATTYSSVASADETENVTVTAKTPDQQVADAKHKIALIQQDPGYYYAGASGATHRVHDVNEQELVIRNAQRYPASVH
jgi:hypothetical protein